MRYQDTFSNDDALAITNPLDLGDRGAISGEEADIKGLLTLLRHAYQERDEACHRIANSLQHVTALLRAQRRATPEKAAQQALRTAEMRLEGITRVHRRISERSGRENVALDAFLTHLGNDLHDALGVRCEVQCPAMTASGEAAGQLAIIISELVMNAVKHAYDGEEGGEVTIRCDDDGFTFYLSVADGGSGFPDGFDFADRSRGIGASLITGAVKNLDGTIEVRLNGGAVVDIRIPLSQIG